MEDGGFAAASALGTGGDYPGVIYIVHISLPYRMIDFAQETRRGGRAGVDVDSIILLEGAEYSRLKKQDLAEFTIDELAMQQFVHTKYCRRFAVSAHLDEEGITCGKVSGKPCYCCGKALPTGRLVMRKSCSDSSFQRG